MSPFASHFTSRLCALLLLGSVWTGVLAPGAVAMSRTDIQQAAGQEGLASEVQEFLNGVLEDAMLRAAIVAPSQRAQTTVLSSLTEREPLTIVGAGVLEHSTASIAPSTFELLYAASNIFAPAPESFGFHHSRAP